MDSHSLHVEPEHHALRLDKFLVATLPHLTRSRLQQLIAEGRLTRGGVTVVDASRKVKQGEQYILTIPAAEPMELEPLAMDLSIVFEDEHLLVIDKPVGLTVHPAAGNRKHTLVNALLHHCGDTLSGIGGVARPGIVHRIDKDTSGLLVVAKNDAAHQHLAAQLKARTLKRTYIAFACGIPSVTRGLVNAPIARHPNKRKEMAIVPGGRHAVTHYEVLTRYGQGCKLQCELDTGRTHQIRVHMKHIGCPLIGDMTYGLSPKQTLHILNNRGIVAEEETQKVILSLSRQALHAAMLRFIHPVTGASIRCEAPLPEDLRRLESALAALTEQG
ncbi:MAG: RNA pseudouridine synthase [Alphaproteobacteria bacterium]|nr:RNA pseudouridine synthase [Alphaproteobacteria bacterium]